MSAGDVLFVVAVLAFGLVVNRWGRRVTGRRP